MTRRMVENPRRSRASRPAPAHAALLVAALFLAGCAPIVKWAGIRLLYDEAPAPQRVLRDLPYRQSDPHPRLRLDLYPAAGDGWPVLVFVPGGGWTGGSKDLVVSGADVYGNIGRFYAHHGIGTAIVGYRLQPEVTWRQQVEDIADALAWVRANVGRFGGDPRALFLSGHSAGAQLATYTALAPWPLDPLTPARDALCGVIAVSGAGYDLADEETYRMGARRSYYEERFRAGDPGDGWLREASAVPWVTPDDPPFLLLYGSREWRSLGHQNRLLERALGAAGVDSRLRVANQTHASMVLALTSEKKLPARSVLEFVKDSRCGERLAAAPH